MEVAAGRYAVRQPGKQRSMLQLVVQVPTSAEQEGMLRTSTEDAQGRKFRDQSHIAFCLHAHASQLLVDQRVELIAMFCKCHGRYSHLPAAASCCCQFLTLAHDASW